ncbi:MAG: hypothetical protein GX447_09095 [Elusimicrobia bacterium]|nr:hypothetical protein [Elusimicrobiota bacterium]
MQKEKTVILFIGFFSFLFTFHFSLQWEKKLSLPVKQNDLLFFGDYSQDEEESEEDSGEEDEYEETVVKNKIEAGTGQKISAQGDYLSANYNFVNFNKDRLSLSISVPSSYLKEYLKNYGYRDEEYEALKSWRQKTIKEAWEKAYVKGGRGEADKAAEEVRLEYDTKLRALFYKRGMALREGNIVVCDMPNIVKRNISELKPLALEIQKQAKIRNYSSNDTIGAAVSFVQTAIKYKIPPSKEGTLHTGGILPPLKAVLSGWGDCDTKTGVLASILGNWSGMKMVGVSVPGHYLMAVRRIPAKGDLFVRYEGLEYVLIEPAGPAWLMPGQVGANTMALLKNSKEYSLEPFFN